MSLLSPQTFSPFQFSYSVMSDSLRPQGLQHARPPCPSPTPRVCWSSCPLSRWCHPTLSSSIVPFSSHLQSFPASGSFPVSQLFASGGQSIGVSASASVLPMNTQDWFPLGYSPTKAHFSSSGSTQTPHPFIPFMISEPVHSHRKDSPSDTPAFSKRHVAAFLSNCCYDEEPTFLLLATCGSKQLEQEQQFTRTEVLSRACSRGLGRCQKQQTLEISLDFIKES